jgi:hypothetical protein
MKLVYALILFLAISMPASSYGEESQFCREDYYKKMSALYQNRNAETAKIIFPVLSCGDEISKPSKRGRLVALIGGYMRENPALIDPLLASANSVKNTEAAKIYLDGLWLCSTKECRKKLKERPFQLPIKDVNNLLAEPPPDPFSIQINDPATLDFLWGYFFGTGDTKIVERVYNLLRDNCEAFTSSESMGVNKRILLSAARWSLVSIASQQELARSALEKQKSLVAQELLKEVARE